MDFLKKLISPGLTGENTDIDARAYFRERVRRPIRNNGMDTDVDCALDNHLEEALQESSANRLETLTQLRENT